jgi:putative ABC transport system permease protein
MTPFLLALSNLTQQRGRTVVSVLGVAFAVLLVFMQLGFLNAVLRTATLLYDHLDFDLILISTEYISLAKPSTFPRNLLARAGSHEQVRAARPVTTSLAQWRSPRPVEGTRPDAPRTRWTILVVAVNPTGLEETFLDPREVFGSEQEMADDAVNLARTGLVLFDRTSRKEYGTAETWKEVSTNELNGRQVEIGGLVKIGTGFAYNGLLLTSEATLASVLGWPSEEITFGLVQLAPGSDTRRAQRELQDFLGHESIRVLTRDELNANEGNFWLTKTAAGQFFASGVAIALLVGGIFVYQMMSADISRRLGEYATIRALGYHAGYLSAVVYWQGALLAVAGYLPGLAIATASYEFTSQVAGIPLVMTPPWMLVVLALAVGMCMASAALAVRQVNRANPADLF